MFEIFEEKYFSELRDFIAPRNKKLLVLLQLRHQEHEEAHELLKTEVIPMIQGVETMKVVASISVSNLENCVEGSDQAKQQDMQYLEAKLNIAEVQSKIEPEKEKLNE